MLSRVSNWELTLTQWARPLIGLPFVWGVTDCHALACGAINAMYGVDLLHLLRGDGWFSHYSAVRRTHNGDSLPIALMNLGACRVQTERVSAGDILFGSVEREEWRSCRVVLANLLCLGSKVGECVTVTRDRSSGEFAMRLPNGGA